MLVLSRHKNESITIDHPDGNIHITIVDIRGDNVRVGVEAPKSVFIHRDEVFQAIQRKGGGR